MTITLANINLGTGPGSGDGDPLRVAFNTINNNFAVLQANINAPASASTALVLVSPAPTYSNSSGSAGQVAVSGANLYICIAPNTWVKSTVTSSF